MNKFIKHLVPICLVLVIIISSLILFSISSLSSSVDGSVVLLSDLQRGMQEASQMLLCISAVASVAYIISGREVAAEQKRIRKRNSYKAKG